MSAYMHMGHNTENLVGEVDLDEFVGIILSPVNRSPALLSRYIRMFHERGDYDIVLDPQLYFPASPPNALQQQPYFPSDIETSDYSADWWSRIVASLANFSKRLDVKAVASPVIQPRVWNEDFFAICTDTCRKLISVLGASDIRVLMTVMADIGYLSDKESMLRTASIVSAADSAGYYLVLVSDIEPRHELSDPNALLGAMTFIRELRSTGRPVFVSHCSSDMILFKAAGASHCATSKYFNLRRFTKSRFRRPSDGGGGGQLPYWFEHSLMAFLRAADVLRLSNRGYAHLIGSLHSNNYWANIILENFRQPSPAPWVGEGWRQYLSWFGKAELALSYDAPHKLVEEWLRTAEANWHDLEASGILTEEPRNNGGWIGPWAQALISFVEEE